MLTRFAFDRVTRMRCDLLQFSVNGVATETPLRRIFYELLDIIMVGIELRFTSEAMDIVEACDQVVNQRTFSGNAFTERMDIEIPDAESQFFKHSVMTNLIKVQDCWTYSRFAKGTHFLMFTPCYCP